MNHLAQKIEDKLMALSPSDGVSDVLIKKSYLAVKRVNYLRQFRWPQRQLLKETRGMRDTKKEKNAFVFAGGPSLRKLDFSKIQSLQHRGFDVIGVNSFISKIKNTLDLKLDYAVFSDPVHFGLRTELPERLKAQFEGDVVQANKDGVKAFIPLRYASHSQFERFACFDDFGNIYSDNVEDITRPLGYYGMTAYRALSVALYLGYDKIYFCGIDNDYFKQIKADKENIAYFEDEHFYKEKRTRRKLSEGSVYNTVDQFLYNCALTFFFLNKFPENRLVNLDPDSLVTQFSKEHGLDVYL
ncbi:MAG: hypothetical protein MI784_03675 [Cytophagales bacterium]|nr:hypothetical protein [Cytophagales bacterium]